DEVLPANGGEGGDQERGVPVLADEGGFSDALERDDLADVGPALGGRLERVQRRLEARIGPPDRAVDHDRDVFGEWAGEGFVEDVGGGAGVGELDAAAALVGHGLVPAR